jgi:hypothetical protein
VRINHAYCTPGVYVLDNEIAQQGRLSRAAFPYDIEMLSAVDRRKPERHLPPQFVPLTYYYVLVHAHPSPNSAESTECL